MEIEWGNLFSAALHSCTIAITWCIVGVSLGTLVGIAFPFWRGIIFVLSVAECLAALPAILLAKTLASSMSDWAFSFWLVLLATVFPSAVQSADLSRKTIHHAEAFFLAAGGNQLAITKFGIIPRLLPTLLNSIKILWPSALLLTLIAEYSGAQSPGGLGKMIVPLLTTGKNLWPFTIVTAGAAFLIYKLFEVFELCLAKKYRDIERQPDDHLIVDHFAKDSVFGEGIRPKWARVLAYRIFPVLFAIFAWCVANGFLMFGRIDLLSFFTSIGYMFSHKDVALHLAQTLLQTVCACLLATVVAGVTAIVLGVLCALHRGLHFFIAQCVLLFQVVPLIALLSIAKLLLREYPMFAGLLVVVSTVFYPVLETVITRTRLFLEKTMILWKAAGANSWQAIYHLGFTPVLGALFSGFQIAAPRTFSAAIIAGVIVVDFGLGSVVRRFTVGDIEKLNIVCAIVCITSIILADGLKLLPRLTALPWKRQLSAKMD